MPTLTVKVTDSSGNETVATHPFQAGGTPLVGDVSGTFGDAFIAGDLNLLGDVFIDNGVLTGIDTFHIQGNGFSIFFQNGGRADLHGKIKGRWGEWGTGERAADTTGWVAGDRLVITPTAKRVDVNGKRLAADFLPIEGLWTEDWDTLIRPDASPDVTSVVGDIYKPEVLNLSQSIVFENLKRGFHFHDSAGVQTLSDVKFLNCGTQNVLAHYPVHFHLLGDNSRGSVLTRVIVEGGKNHAFVPHGSHGISFPGCAAYNTLGPAFWWDPPTGSGDISNDPKDIGWDDCLVVWVKNDGSVGNSRTAGFALGAGVGLSCNRSVATCVFGNPDATSDDNRARSGFHWPEGSATSAQQAINGSREPWKFQFCRAHNNVDNGLLVWQNSRAVVNLLEDFIAYHNGFEGVFHGSYINRYHYRGVVLTGNGFRQIAKSPPEGPMVVEGVISDTRLIITSSGNPSMYPTYTRGSEFPEVVLEQTAHPSFNVVEDCGLTPPDFDVAQIAASSIIEIKEGGVLTHRWQSGVWS